MHQSPGLVPDKEVVFDADSPPETLNHQQSFTTGDPPEITYGRSAEAWMDGEDGLLAAYAGAELNGIPPSASSSLGIYAEADLLGFDTFQVTSDVLEDGTDVEPAFDMLGLGNGRVWARMYVDRIEGGGARNRKLSLSYNDSGGGNVTDFSDGSFVAKVGEVYALEYSLLVSVGLTPFGMNEANATRFLVSDYPNAHYYGGPARPLGGV